MRSQKPEARSQNSRAETRAPAREFTDLLVWKKAHDLALSIYQVTLRLLEGYVGAITKDIENGK